MDADSANLINGPSKARYSNGIKFWFSSLGLTSHPPVSQGVGFKTSIACTRSQFGMVPWKRGERMKILSLKLKRLPKWCSLSKEKSSQDGGEEGRENLIWWENRKLIFDFLSLQVCFSSSRLFWRTTIFEGESERVKQWERESEPWCVSDSSQFYIFD